jgi:hypothetical protein
LLWIGFKGRHEAFLRVNGESPTHVNIRSNAMSKLVFRGVLILLFLVAFVWLRQQSETDHLRRQASCLEHADHWDKFGRRCLSRE